METGSIDIVFVAKVAIISIIIKNRIHNGKLSWKKNIDHC